MTPGTYLRLRREAAGRTIAAVAGMISTTPPWKHRSRAEWIALVEADVVVISADIVIALHEVFSFDRHVLVQLIAIHADAKIPAPDVCRTCGCSWNDPCLDERQVGCGWRGSARDVCTECPDRSPFDPCAIALPDRSAEPLPGVEAISANFERTYRFQPGRAH